MADQSSLLTRGHYAEVAEAERVLAKHYGLEGTASRLAGERDDNFRLNLPGREPLFMKIAHSSEERVVTNFQTSALMHLSDLEDVAIPKVVLTLDGEPEALVALGGTPRIVRVTTFLKGRPLTDFPESLQLRRSIGEALARVTLGFEGFEHEAAQRPQMWDIARADGLEDMVVSIEDAVIVARLESLLARFRERVLPVIPTLRKQIVHNDLSADNMHGEADHVTGVLDFGDMTRTAVVFDLAVAAAYQLGDDENPLSNALDLISAFHRVKPLTDDEVEILFESIVARMLVRLTITEWRATRFPENRDYILRNNPRSWRILERLLARDTQAATRDIKGSLASASEGRN